MNKLAIGSLTIEELSNRINDLRDVLNEACCTDQNTESQEQRLIISRNLDELIVNYMIKMSATHVASGK